MKLEIIIYAGVRRLPAILTTGCSLKEVGCERYEVALCDPLHDFKNLICHLLTELPHHVQDAQLKLEISKFTKAALGEKVAKSTRPCKTPSMTVTILTNLKDVGSKVLLL